MAGGLLYRMFGVGKMPPVVRAEIAGEAVLFQTEGIRVTLHRSGRVPGAVVAGGVNLGWGAFAVTTRRVIGTRGGAKLVDVPLDQQTGGPASVRLDATGLHVRFDLAKVHPSCQGEMRVEFHQPLSELDLARFPIRELSFPVDPQRVVRMFGSLKKLPDSDGLRLDQRG